MIDQASKQPTNIDQESSAIDCGVFDSWGAALKKAEELIISDQPQIIATISLAEYKRGQWWGMSLDQPDLGSDATALLNQLKDICPFMYPAAKIHVLLIERAGSKQILTVHLQSEEKIEG